VNENLKIAGIALVVVTVAIVADAHFGLAHKLLSLGDSPAPAGA
jgi:hypothetical protein